MQEYQFSVIRLGRQDRNSFTSGNAALDAYFLTQAGQDMKRRVAACFVCIDNLTGAIAGYYTLSACHVQLAEIDESLKKKLPRYPVVPAVRLGRLAVDLRYQGKKLGASLLDNAVARSLMSDVAAHMMIVEAKDDTAAAFYLHHGFRCDPMDPHRLYAPLYMLGRVSDLQ